MALSTYLELFQAALEERIAAGGDVSLVVTLVNVYQGEDPTARHFLFQEWLGDFAFVCGRCGRLFSPDPQEVEEDDYVLCPQCRRG